jgi:hypothetical protein
MLVSILILVFTVMSIAGSCATEKKAYVAKENEELYGTWVNKEYNSSRSGFYARHIINADGTIQLHATDDSPRVVAINIYIITDKWSDSAGNIWYKAIITERAKKEAIGKSSLNTTEPTYVLAKISNSGKILETVKSGVDYPTELNPDVLIYSYNILYRQ